MPRNIEIKAAIKNVTRAHRIAALLSDTEPELIQQNDVFFRVESGRLKLRILGPEKAELISYHRSDISEARLSDYHITPVRCPAKLLAEMAETHTIVGLVSKHRFLYRFGHTRIHIDHVCGLGDFLEFEVVMENEHEDQELEAHYLANELLKRFGVKAEEMIGEAYVDLLNMAQREFEWRSHLRALLRSDQIPGVIPHKGLAREDSL